MYFMSASIVSVNGNKFIGFYIYDAYFTLNIMIDIWKAFNVF